MSDTTPIQTRKPTHPGGFFYRNIMVRRGLTIEDVATALNVPCLRIEEFIVEGVDVDCNLAMKLHKATDTTPESWLNMQLNFDKWQAVYGHYKEEFEAVLPLPGFVYDEDACNGEDGDA